MQCTLTAFAELAYHDGHMVAEAVGAAFRWKLQAGYYSGERESTLLPSSRDCVVFFRSSSLLAVHAGLVHTSLAISPKAWFSPL